MPDAQWLAVQAGGGRFLVPLKQAGEIFPATAAQVLPYARPWFRGVVHLRGELYGVADLAQFLASDGLELPPAVRTDVQWLSFAPALALNCALVVDRIDGLRAADAFVQAELPAADAPPYCGPRHTDATGQIWQELNLRALAQSPSFLAIDA